MSAAVFGDVTSANVVGYMNQQFIKGAEYKGPQFVAIGDGKMLDLKVQGYSGDVDERIISVSKINEYGINYKDLIWTVIEDGDDSLYGWYFDNGEDLVDSNDDPLLAGEGLVVQTDDKGVNWELVNSGEVAMDGVAVTLVKGAQYLACAVPRDSTFGEVIVSGYTGDVDEKIVSASKLNEFGINYQELIWTDIEDGADSLFGWYFDGPEDLEDYNEEPLTAGQGLWVQAEDKGAGWTLTFPPAIPVKK